MNSLPRRTLLADDYEPTRKSPRTFLEEVPETEVIGEAEYGRIPMEFIYKPPPNIIMDIRIAAPERSFPPFKTAFEK